VLTQEYHSIALPVFGLEMVAGLLVALRTSPYTSHEVQRLARLAGMAALLVGRTSSVKGGSLLQEQLRHSQKMEAIGRLAGGVAHDFNNLLTVILSTSELLASQVALESPQHSEIQTIRDSAERGAALTRQLLTFSRPQAAAAAILDPRAILIEMESFLRRLIGEDIELLVRLRPVGRVRIGRDHLEQVLMNLVVNARDAMPAGGRLFISTADVDLDEPYAQIHFELTPGPYVMISVTDTGCGMDEPTRARLFEPFFTTKKRGEGTGLGLSTVYGIVKQSGGGAVVYSEPGQGTTFKIYLPRCSSEQLTEVRKHVPPRSLSGTEAILLVEDEATVRRLARRLLEVNGYTVFEASGPEEALRVLKGQRIPIDLMLSDIVMPVMSGVTLQRRLAEIRPQVKVLLMSGYTDDALIRHGLLEDATPFLPKPFTPRALLEAVRTVLDTGPRSKPAADADEEEAR
jgi:signal transduction histidine kinase/ActR/RegA family two-component response regulator